MEEESSIEDLSKESETFFERYVSTGEISKIEDACFGSRFLIPSDQFEAQFPNYIAIVHENIFKSPDSDIISSNILNLIKNSICKVNAEESEPIQQILGHTCKEIDSIFEKFNALSSENHQNQYKILIPIFEILNHILSCGIKLAFPEKGNFIKFAKQLIDMKINPDDFHLTKYVITMKTHLFSILIYQPQILNFKLDKLLNTIISFAIKLQSPFLDTLDEIYEIIAELFTIHKEDIEKHPDFLHRTIKTLCTNNSSITDMNIFIGKVLEQILTINGDQARDLPEFVSFVYKFIQDVLISPMKYLEVLDTLISSIQFSDENNYVSYMSYIQVGLGDIISFSYKQVNELVKSDVIANSQKIYEISHDFRHAIHLYAKIVVPSESYNLILDESFKSAKEIIDNHLLILKFVTNYQNFTITYENYAKNSITSKSFNEESEIILKSNLYQKQLESLIRSLPVLFECMPKSYIEVIFTMYFNYLYDNSDFTLLKFSHLEDRDLFGEIFRIMTIEASERLFKNNNVRKTLKFISDSIDYAISVQQSINPRIAGLDIDYIIFACVIVISNQLFFEETLITLLSVFNFLTIFQIKNNDILVPANVRDILTASIIYNNYIPQLTDFLQYIFKIEPKYIGDQNIIMFLIHALPKMPDKVLPILQRVRKADKKNLIESENKEELLGSLSNLIDKLDSEEKKIALSIIGDIAPYCDTPRYHPSSFDICDRKVVDFMTENQKYSFEFFNFINGILKTFVKFPVKSVLDCLLQTIFPYLDEIVWTDDKHRFVSKVFSHLIEYFSSPVVEFFKKLIEKFTKPNYFVLSHLYFASANFNPLNKEICELIFSNIKTKTDFSYVIKNSILLFEMKLSMGEATRILLLKIISSYADQTTIDVISFADLIAKLINSDLIPDNNSRCSKPITIYELKCMPAWLQKATYLCRKTFESSSFEDGKELFERIIHTRNPYEAMIYIEVLQNYKNNSVVSTNVKELFSMFETTKSIEIAQILAVILRIFPQEIKKNAEYLKRYLTDKNIDDWPEIIIEFGIPLYQAKATDFDLSCEFILESMDAKYGVVVPRHAIVLAKTLMKCNKSYEENFINIITENIDLIRSFDDLSLADGSSIFLFFDYYSSLTPEKFVPLFEKILSLASEISDEFSSKDVAVDVQSLITSTIHAISHHKVAIEIKNQDKFDVFISLVGKVFERIPSIITELSITDFWRFAKLFGDKLVEYIKENDDESLLNVLPVLITNKRGYKVRDYLWSDPEFILLKIKSSKISNCWIVLATVLYSKRDNEQIHEKLQEIYDNYLTAKEMIKYDIFVINKLVKYLSINKFVLDVEKLNHEQILFATKHNITQIETNPDNDFDDSTTLQNMSLINLTKIITNDLMLKNYIENLEIFGLIKVNSELINEKFIELISNTVKSNMFYSDVCYKLMHIIAESIEDFKPFLSNMSFITDLLFINDYYEESKVFPYLIDMTKILVSMENVDINLIETFVARMKNIMNRIYEKNEFIMKYSHNLIESLNILSTIHPLPVEFFQKTCIILPKLHQSKRDHTNEKALIAIIKELHKISDKFDFDIKCAEFCLACMNTDNFELSLASFPIVQKFLTVEPAQEVLMEKLSTLKDVPKGFAILSLWQTSLAYDSKISSIIKNASHIFVNTPTAASIFVACEVLKQIFSLTIENSQAMISEIISNAVEEKRFYALKVIYLALSQLAKNGNKNALIHLNSLTNVPIFVEKGVDSSIIEFPNLLINILNILSDVPSAFNVITKFIDVDVPIIRAAKILSVLFDTEDIISLSILRFISRLETNLISNMDIPNSVVSYSVLRQGFDSDLADWPEKVDLSDNPDYNDSSMLIVPKPLLESHLLYFNKAIKDCGDDQEMIKTVSMMMLHKGERCLMRDFADSLPKKATIQEIQTPLKRIIKRLIPNAQGSELFQFIAISQIRRFAREILKSKEQPNIYIKISPAEMSNVQIAFDDAITKFNKATNRVLPVKTNLIEKSAIAFMEQEEREFNPDEKKPSELLIFLLSRPPNAAEANLAYPLIRKCFEKNPHSFVAFATLYHLAKSGLVSAKKVQTSLVPISKIPWEYSHLFGSLFINEPNLSNLLTRIHPAYLFLVDTKKNDSPILEAIKKACSESRFNDITERTGEYENTSYYYRVCIPNSSPLLETQLLSEVIELSFRYDSCDANYMRMSALLYSGERVNYIITPTSFSSPETTVACRELSRIFGRSPPSFMRNQRLMIVESAKIDEGIYLTRTDSLPFVKNDFALEKNSFKAFDTKKSYVEWTTQFAYNFAALSAVLHVRRAETFNEFRSLLDKKSALLSQPRLACVEEAKNSLRVINAKRIMMGPFKNGFISACDALALKVARVKMLGVTLFGDSQEISAKCEARMKYYSLRFKDSDEVQEKLNKLIQSESNIPFSWF